MNSCKYILIFIILCATSHVVVAVNMQDSVQYRFKGMRIEQKEYSTQVIWSVLGEYPGSIYLIEKAIERNAWEEKTRIPSENPDSIYYEYNQAISDHIEAPIEYYRLSRIVDDGSHVILDTVTVYHKILSKIKITAPPGQSAKSATIEYKALIHTPVKITIENIEGEVLYEERGTAVKGENWHTIKLKKFQPGRYLVVVRDIHENKVQKIMHVY